MASLRFESLYLFILLKKNSSNIYSGVICVLCSFPFCFQLQTFNLSLLLSSFIYYTIFIIIFQFGWACSQIGHLSMLNELTPKDGERVALNAYRHAWSIVANIFVYAVTWLLLDHNQTKDNIQMDANVFQVNLFSY